MVDTRDLPKGRRRRILEGYDDETGTWTTESVSGQIIQALGFGNFMGASARAAGITDRAVFDWLARAREHDPGPESDLSEVPDTERPYVHFLRQVERAQGRCEMALVLTVQKGARDDPKLALQLLGRRFKDWREHKGVDITVADDRRQDRVAKAVAADPNLALKAQEFALAAGTVIADDDDDGDT